MSDKNLHLSQPARLIQDVAAMLPSTLLGSYVCCQTRDTGTPATRCVRQAQPSGNLRIRWRSDACRLVRTAKRDRQIGAALPSIRQVPPLTPWILSGLKLLQSRKHCHLCAHCVQCEHVCLSLVCRGTYPPITTLSTLTKNRTCGLAAGLRLCLDCSKHQVRATETQTRANCATLCQT